MVAYWNCLQSAVLHLMGLCAPSVQAQSVEEARTLLLLLNVYWRLMVIVSNTARLAALPAEPTTKDTSPDLRLFIIPYTFLQIQVFLSMTLCCWVNGSRHFKCSQCLNLQESAVLCWIIQPWRKRQYSLSKNWEPLSHWHSVTLLKTSG